MALQWLILTYVVAAEAAVAILLTLPTPKLLRDRFASLVSLILQPALFIVPFAGFQLLGALLLFLKRVSLISSSNNWVGLKIISFILLDWWVDIYWKNEHRLMCTSEVCTAAERDRYEKSIYKAQRNVILCVTACLLYWSISRICKYQKEIQSLEEGEKRIKSH
ncbi:hypothetical protein GmHk_07G018972 [Glycine max]|nr:hypothetical protein GmHk_07G018972 [Glycine max]